MNVVRLSKKYIAGLSLGTNWAHQHFPEFVNSIDNDLRKDMVMDLTDSMAVSTKIYEIYSSIWEEIEEQTKNI